MLQLPRADSWPAGMQLVLERHVQPVPALLFVRRVWGLADELDLPALEPTPNPGASARPEQPAKNIWDRRWLSLWERVWGWYGPGVIQVPGTGRPRRFATGRTPGITRPGLDFWSTRYGAHGIDQQAFDHWQMTYLARAPLPDLGEVEPVLVAAWERGLRHLVELPVAGYYQHRLDASRMVISPRCLGDAGLLSRALAEWIRRG